MNSRVLTVLKKISRAYSRLVYLHSSASNNNRSTAIFILEYLFLRRICGFTRENYQLYDFASSKRTLEQKIEFISSDPNILNRVWTTLDPVLGEILLGNKISFYGSAKIFGIRTPGVLGVFGPGWGNICNSHESLSNKQLVVKFLAEEGKDGIVIKPIEGAQMKLTYIGEVDDNTPVNIKLLSGREISLSELYDECIDEKLFRKNFPVTDEDVPMHGFLIQKRLYQHQLLEDLFGPIYTAVRILTCLNQDNSVDVLAAKIQILDPVNAANSNDSMVVNIPIDLDTGEYGSGVLAKIGNNEKIDKVHFRRRSFIGQRHPNWIEVRELAIKAQRLFPQCPVAGWDVSIDQTGKPLILEGNTRWGVSTIQGPNDKGLYKGTIRNRLPDLYKLDRGFRKFAYRALLKLEAR